MSGLWVKVFPAPPVVKPELPGLGGWADISDTPTSTYTDAKGVKWNVWTFNADGTLNVTTEGLLDVLLVGRGGPGNGGEPWPGSGGDVVDGTMLFPAGALPVVVNTAATAGGAPSSLGSVATGIATSNNGPTGAGGTLANETLGKTFTITGTPLLVSPAGAVRVATASGIPGAGGGANLGSTTWGNPGIVIVRRPA